jgi:hypothetical protein
VQKIFRLVLLKSVKKYKFFSQGIYTPLWNISINGKKL